VPGILLSYRRDGAAGWTGRLAHEWRFATLRQLLDVTNQNVFI